MGLSHGMTAYSIVLISQPQVRSEKICEPQAKARHSLARLVNLGWPLALSDMYYHHQGPPLQWQKLQSSNRRAFLMRGRRAGESLWLLHDVSVPRGGILAASAHE